MPDYSTYKDRELVDLLSQGNEAAFTEIYERYKTVLFLHVRRMLDEDDQARDVIQELFVSLWVKRAELVVKTSLKSYLYTAVKNKVLNILMHNKHHDLYMQSMLDVYKEGKYSTDEVVREKELAGIIEQEINRLPARMREVFVLSRKEHLSYSEIASKMSISEETVKKQISYALKILRIRINLVLFASIVTGFLK